MALKLADSYSEGLTRLEVLEKHPYAYTTDSEGHAKENAAKTVKLFEEKSKAEKNAALKQIMKIADKIPTESELEDPSSNENHSWETGSSSSSPDVSPVKRNNRAKGKSRSRQRLHSSNNKSDKKAASKSRGQSNSKKSTHSSAKEGNMKHDTRLPRDDSITERYSETHSEPRSSGIQPRHELNLQSEDRMYHSSSTANPAIHEEIVDYDKAGETSRRPASSKVPGNNQLGAKGCNNNTASSSTSTNSARESRAQKEPVEREPQNEVHQSRRDAITAQINMRAADLSKFSQDTQLLFLAIKRLNIDLQSHSNAIQKLQDCLTDRDLLNKVDTVTVQSFAEKYGLILPLQTKEDFTGFDQRLKHQEEFCAKFTSTLAHLLTKDVQKSFAAILKSYISRNLAMSCTAVRKSNNKMIFKDTKFNDCLFALICQYYRGENNEALTEKDYHQALSTCFSNAKDWHGHRAVRRQVAVNGNAVPGPALNDAGDAGVLGE